MLYIIVLYIMSYIIVLYIVEMVTTSTKTLHLVFLVFSSAEAIDSIQTKDWHNGRP